MTKHHCLTIERMPEGGFVVFEGRGAVSDPSRYCGPLFACTGMGEALAFIGRQLEPGANQATGAAIGAAGGLIGAAFSREFTPADALRPRSPVY